MTTKQFLLPIASEITVDLFAGGGGASTGLEQALGRHVDIAVNHDPEAIALHTINHPQTEHYVSDVFEINPHVATRGRPVGLLWASPDCKHFSKAKGGKPVSKRIRGLAWVVVKWAKAVRPRVIILENVEEFQTWGPLTDDGMPCPERKGQTFQLWKEQLRALGYRLEYKELRACDYGAPTIRKRFFMVARCDGLPIVWPQQTHFAKPAKGQKAWRPASDIIDWSIPCPSIFLTQEEGRALGIKRPLADATCRRIAKGVMRYVVESANPFIVSIANWSGESVRSTEDPLSTVTANPKGGHHAVVVPTLIQTGYGERPGQAPRVPGLEKPLGTIVASQKHAVVAAFLAKHYTGVVGSDLQDPIGTVTSVDHHSLITANLIHMGHGEGKAGGERFSHGIRDVEQPLNTVTASGCPAGLVTSHLVKLRNNQFGQGHDEPMPTLTAGGGHVGEVRSFLVKYYGNEQDGVSLHDPLHTIPTRDRFGLVTVHGVDYQIVDIGLRMLTPRELYRAQGFPDSYIIDQKPDGSPLTKTAQVRMCGNSVCPPLAHALVRANYSDQQISPREKVA
ncbi:DNA cytosine methyltransferase [Alcaligenes faecalis]|uniref:DNA cytosine methyltransferase n=1 Tax=Alcaligenes faecalis TaxID=511 RepID=UPI00211BDEA8|nr:DNA cytosine methyltransferase [Alcaligenes faecalis]UUO12709.1 DNA cytosine methyltransferase [Alcaligenes faecalis]